jgi:uncharacterized protein
VLIVMFERLHRIRPEWSTVLLLAGAVAWLIGNAVRSPGVLRSDPPGLHTAVMDTGPRRVVLDTNVFVAAGFNPGSHSARLVEAVRDRRLRMVWDDATRTEIEHVMRQIPRLSWTRVADLLCPENRYGGSTHPEAFGFVPDPADRKFAALADAVQAPLVTSDAGLLNVAGQMAVPVLKPSEFARRCGALNMESGLHWQVDELAG